jgi:hypothetical protein
MSGIDSKLLLQGPSQSTDHMPMMGYQRNDGISGDPNPSFAFAAYH